MVVDEFEARAFRLEWGRHGRYLSIVSELFLKVVYVESVAVVVDCPGMFRELQSDGIEVVDCADVGFVEHELVLEGVEGVEVLPDEVVTELDLFVEALSFLVAEVCADGDEREGCQSGYCGGEGCYLIHFVLWLR